MANQPAPYYGDATVETDRPQHKQDIILEIEGMQQLPDGTFMIHDVATVDVPWQDMDKILLEAGVSKTLVAAHMEVFVENLNNAMIGEAIARRSKRVG